MTGDRPVLTVNVFPGGFNWGLYVGRDKGFFADHGIAVEVQGTPNSVTQMTDFSQGKFDIAMTAVDNVVAYVEGQGEAPIGPQGDFMAVMGSDSGFLSLVTSASVARIEGLAGKTLSVDAMTTGYAFVLYEIMRRNGLDKAKGDYQIVRAGGMVQRWNALARAGTRRRCCPRPITSSRKMPASPNLRKLQMSSGPIRAMSQRCAAVGRGKTATRLSAS